MKLNPKQRIATRDGSTNWNAYYLVEAFFYISTHGLKGNLSQDQIKYIYASILSVHYWSHSSKFKLIKGENFRDTQIQLSWFEYSYIKKHKQQNIDPIKFSSTFF